ncbi:hypothetical protein FPV67DRAFT_1428038, partial [Lyophyllum atratum]
NFALHSSGARIVRELTSPTLGLSPLNVHIQPPTVILQDNSSVGACWEFSGSHGYFGVLLPQPIRVSEITMYYPPAEVLSPDSFKQAPRDVVVFGLISVDTWTELLQNGSEPHLSPPVPPQRFSVDIENFSQAGSSAIPKPSLGSSVLLPLTKFIFANPATPHPVEQIFPLCDQSRNLSLETMVIEVMSNWGAGTTCVYKMGIHGEAANFPQELA